MQAVDESQLVAALRAGDEAAFMRLVELYGPSMLRLARMFVRSQAVAEEVVQEAWLGVLRGIDRFEGRSSLRTWIFRIVANTAKTRGEREGRSVPFSALAGEEDEGPSVAPERFQGAGRALPGRLGVVPGALGRGPGAAPALAGDARAWSTGRSRRCRPGSAP